MVRVNCVFGPGCSGGDDVGEVGGDHMLMDSECSLECRCVARGIRGNDDDR